MAIVRASLILLCLATSVLAQQPPSVPSEYVVQACYAMARQEFDNALGSAANQRWSEARVTQLTTQVAELQKKLAEAEARIEQK